MPDMPWLTRYPCSMCGRAPATTEYFAPVCQACHDWLVVLEGELDKLEREDPAVAEAAKKVDDLLRGEQ